MCNFIRSNGEQCKLARNKERCGKHPIIIEQEIIVVETNIVETVMAPNQAVDTSAIEVVDTQAPSVIKPVEVVFDELSDVPEVEVSVVQVIADGAVYKEDQTSDLNLNNSSSDDDNMWDVYHFDSNAKDTVGTFSEFIDAWRSLGEDIDHQCVKKPNSELEAQGYLTRFQIDNHKGEQVAGRRRFYFKSDEDKIKFLGFYEKLNMVEYFLSNGLYDQRLYKLCCLLKRSWFSDNNNTWSLAGVLYRKQHVDLGLMRKTYLCILYTMTDRFDQAAALKVFNEWETSKYHPKITESQLKSAAAGSDTKAYNEEWKDEYEPKEVEEKKEPKTKNDDKQSTLDILRESLIKLSKDRFKREFETGVIYELKTKYYYTRKFDDPAVFLNHVFEHEPLYHCIKSKDHTELIKWLRLVINPEFPFIELNYDYIGFSNGIYDLSTATFTDADQVVDNIQVRTFIPYNFEDNDHAPLLDAYLKYQFDDETIEFIYFMIGRLLAKLNDKFDFMVLLYGEGGSGKSLLLNLVKYAFGNGQVGILSNSHQETFGLSEYSKKQILCCDDMDNLAKTLPKADFLSMGTRGSVQCPVKGKGSIEIHDWDIPTIINSNKLPNYSDKAGEVVRRFLVANFENIIDKDLVNTNLENEIKESEFGVFLHRCRSTYLRFCVEHKNKGVESFCPLSFIEKRNLLRMATNNTFQFISEKCKFEEGSKMTLPTLNKEMKAYIKERFEMKVAPKDNINIQNVLLVDARFQHKKVNICKSCREEHTKVVAMLMIVQIVQNLNGS